ncbi:hypothetical protein ISU07_08060 [Nocardioides islandensis]|uniref:Uncharacterized protein n=1 Tax=Nocardioides islandensis TaxID=433663 RepID=A0A930YHK9_9ACTN|nr:hypothetical protein [Nocardioides islandensis]MBF4763079.1 hypothetical protein [Nocardioides islandensis]
MRTSIPVTHPPRVDRGVVATLIRPQDRLVVGVLAGPGSRLADGVRAGLAGSPDLSAEVRPLVRSVTVEAPYRGAAVDAARMLEDGVRVIVADLPTRVLRRLGPLCRQYGAALVAVSTGSLEVPDPLDGVVHVSEQRWDAAFELGDWSARHLEARLFQVIAAPEAEFDVVDALARGHRGAGGEVAGSATTHDGAAGPAGDTGAEAAALAALVAGAGTVAVHATDRAGDVVRAVRRTCGDVAILLVGPDEDAVRELSRRFGAVYSATTASAATTATDAGRLVAQAAALLAERGGSWADLTTMLAGATLEGQAGPVVLDPLTHSTRALVVVRRTSTGRPTVVARRASI